MHFSLLFISMPFAANRLGSLSAIFLLLLVRFLVSGGPQNLGGLSPGLLSCPLRLNATCFVGEDHPHGMQNGGGKKDT